MATALTGQKGLRLEGYAFSPLKKRDKGDRRARPKTPNMVVSTPQAGSSGKYLTSYKRDFTPKFERTPGFSFKPENEWMHRKYSPEILKRKRDFLDPKTHPLQKECEKMKEVALYQQKLREKFSPAWTRDKTNYTSETKEKIDHPNVNYLNLRPKRPEPLTNGPSLAKAETSYSAEFIPPKKYIEMMKKQAQSSRQNPRENIKKPNQQSQRPLEAPNAPQPPINNSYTEKMLQRKAKEPQKKKAVPEEKHKEKGDASHQVPLNYENWRQSAKLNSPSKNSRSPSNSPERISWEQALARKEKELEAWEVSLREKAIALDNSLRMTSKSQKNQGHQPPFNKFQPENIEKTVKKPQFLIKTEEHFDQTNSPKRLNDSQTPRNEHSRSLSAVYVPGRVVWFPEFPQSAKSGNNFGRFGIELGQFQQRALTPRPSSSALVHHDDASGGRFRSATPKERERESIDFEKVFRMIKPPNFKARHPELPFTILPTSYKEQFGPYKERTNRIDILRRKSNPNLLL